MDVETVVIGAGVVGLAVSAELAREGHAVLVLERHERFGQETSSYNSEVIHAGLYYRPGSLKARLCLEGNRALRQLGLEGKVPVRLTGKLVVGADEEEEAVQALHANAVASGAEGLELLGREAIRSLEPQVQASFALHSSHTGIVDSHALMRYFLIRGANAGVEVAYRSEVVGLHGLRPGFALDTVGPDGERYTLTAEKVVNAAGLGADSVAALAGIDIDVAGYRLHPCKGDYFSTAPRCWKFASRLIYPVPGPRAAGLGIHVTLDMGGRLRLGPDATYLEPGQPSSHRADPAKRALFASAVRRYLPAICEDDLTPEFAGIRPKLQAPGGPPRDFVVMEESSRGLPGLVNLIGIESPGLTASPALATMVRKLLEQ